MAITYYSEAVKMPPIKKRLTTKWILEIARQHGKRVGEISYLFCDDYKILETNKQFLQHDYYTDIITFDYNTGDLIAGDILISVDTVMSNSAQFNTDFNEEIHRIIIHGILHLCGLEDKKPDDKAQMTAAENEALQLLKDMTKEENA